MGNRKESICRISSHKGHEWIRNGKYEYCICCYATRLAKRVVPPRVKKALLVES